jgi:predicted Na+-dependent transporter
VRPSPGLRTKNEASLIVNSHSNGGSCRYTAWRWLRARQVAQVTFLPVIAGFLIPYFLPGLADRIGNPLRILGNIFLTILLLAVVVIPAIAPDLRLMLNLGWEATMAIVLMVALSLASTALIF